MQDGEAAGRAVRCRDMPSSYTWSSMSATGTRSCAHACDRGHEPAGSPIPGIEPRYDTVGELVRGCPAGWACDITMIEREFRHCEGGPRERRGRARLAKEPRRRLRGGQRQEPAVTTASTERRACCYCDAPYFLPPAGGLVWRVYNSTSMIHPIVFLSAPTTQGTRCGARRKDGDGSRTQSTAITRASVRCRAASTHGAALFVVHRRCVARNDGRLTARSIGASGHAATQDACLRAEKRRRLRWPRRFDMRSPFEGRTAWICPICPCN